MLKSPSFWRNGDSVLVKVLSPLSKVYSFISTVRANSILSEKATAPVICVGNVVVGGAGKTTTVQLICDILKEKGHNPHIISSGYGGYLKNVVRVDPTLHSYLQVGDEALLSANVATTWVGKNRLNSARAATLAGADVLVMDDGLQNKSLVQDFKVMVVDSGQQFGNERLFPAGPLRETVESGLKKSDIVLIIGEKNEELMDKIRQIKPNIQICCATTKIVGDRKFSNNNVIGFCGLGYPEKFRKTLNEIGLNIKDFIAFADHHPYTITESQKLIKAAKNAGAMLVTTMKDYVKVPDVFKHEMTVISIKLHLDNDLLPDLLEKMMDGWKEDKDSSLYVKNKN
ncbi:MAG: tetraacyldisaccharide 4'-kinase [Holosporales bacterium]|jgi:tetraacyldisaccharide 4'-kinase|nr:tetraacyldisaccharide 4'-kinase [Holosporales bacterium]